jgi:hypothetical protein
MLFYPSWPGLTRPSIDNEGAFEVGWIAGSSPAMTAISPSLRPVGREKTCFISLSFWPFGDRTPPRSRPPHPWRLAVSVKRAADRGL